MGPDETTQDLTTVEGTGSQRDDRPGREVLDENGDPDGVKLTLETPWWYQEKPDVGRTGGVRVRAYRLRLWSSPKTKDRKDLPPRSFSSCNPFFLLTLSLLSPSDRTHYLTGKLQ